MAGYFWAIAISIDQLINSLLGGYPDETISSRAGKRALRGKHFPANLINAIFFWQANHCWESIEYDEGRAVSKVNSIKSLKEGGHAKSGLA